MKLIPTIDRNNHTDARRPLLVKSGVRAGLSGKYAGSSSRDPSGGGVSNGGG